MAANPQITEGESELVVHANVPGFNENDLKVEAAPRCLCILGRHEEAPGEIEEKVGASQRRCQRIFRLLDLPSEIDPDGMKATVRDGILEINLPKVAVREKDRLVAKAAAA